jgi:hypothetical protein
MDTIWHSTTSRRYFQKFEFQSVYDTWLFESKLSNSLDPDEIPEILDFSRCVHPTKEFGVLAGTPFFQQAHKFRSEYPVLYRLAVLTQNDVLLKYTVI